MNGNVLFFVLWCICCLTMGMAAGLFREYWGMGALFFQALLCCKLAQRAWEDRP